MAPVGGIPMGQSAEDGDYQEIPRFYNKPHKIAVYKACKSLSYTV